LREEQTKNLICGINDDDYDDDDAADDRDDFNVLQLLFMTIRERTTYTSCLYSFRNKSLPDIKKHIFKIEGYKKAAFL
jgi:hypothetical protein